jgi:hypothetical protein
MDTTSARTDWSDKLAMRVPRIKSQLKELPNNIEKALNLCNDGLLLDMFGSRSLPWRIFLGLLSP